jgi:hypothetical protein
MKLFVPIAVKGLEWYKALLTMANPKSPCPVKIKLTPVNRKPLRPGLAQVNLKPTRPGLTQVKPRTLTLGLTPVNYQGRFQVNQKKPTHPL